MEKLFNMSTNNKYLSWFENDWSKVEAFRDKHTMDGIELGDRKSVV